MNNKNQSPTPLSASKHLVLVQLTRAGDLIQTMQAASSIKEERPGLKLTLIARKFYADSLANHLLSVFDEVITVDTQKLFSKDLHEAGQQVRDLVKNTTKTPVTALVNLSLCRPSKYLCGLIPAKHRLGPWIDSSNNEIIEDKQSQLLYSTITQGPLNAFHLVDFFRMILGAKRPQAPKHHSSKRNSWVVVHPFASAERKRWKSHKWVEVLFKIAKDHPGHTFFVVGSPSEEKLANEIFSNTLLKLQKNVVNLTGQTTLNDVYDRLTKSCYFIGHDSLIGHLASLANTPTMTLALGSVRPWETAPYGEGNIILSPRTSCFPCFPDQKCSDYACHSDMPYQLITDLVKVVLRGNADLNVIQQASKPYMTSNCQLQITHLNPQTQFLGLIDIFQRPSSVKSMMRGFYRMVWSYIVFEKEESTAFPQLARDTHASLLQVLEGIGYLYELSEYGKKYSRQIVEEIAKPTPALQRVKNLSAKIDEVDQLAQLVKKSHATLAPLVDYFNLGRANLSGDNLVQMAEQSFFVYQECSLSCKIMSELIEKTIAEYKLGQNGPSKEL